MGQTKGKAQTHKNEDSQLSKQLSIFDLFLISICFHWTHILFDQQGKIIQT
jgi:hypothetical protein